MLCDKCGKQEATVKFVQIENNKRRNCTCAEIVPMAILAFLQDLIFSTSCPAFSNRWAWGRLWPPL